MDFVLKIGSRIADENMSMGERDTYNDRVIAFEAITTAEIPSRLAAERQPLQPTNHQVPLKPLMPKPDSPGLSGSKALFVPMLPNPFVTGRPQDENAQPVPQAAQYQDLNLKARNQPLQGRVQSMHPDIRSLPGSAPPSSMNMLVPPRSTTPGARNTASISTQDPLRVEQ